jgi:hypothetical protein
MRINTALAVPVSLAVMAALLTSQETATAAPALQLPWPTGHQHRINGGNAYGCGTHSGPQTAISASAYNADYYAIDFQFGLDDGSPLDVSATAAGTVIVRENAGDGYGNKVVLDHGGGYYSVYAHFRATNTWGPGIAVGVYVAQGRVVGYAGDTGNVPVHLHMHMMLNLDAYRAEPMSSITGFGWYGYSVENGVGCSSHPNDPSPYWTSQPPVLTGADVCSWSSSRLNLFARSTNGGLWQKYWTPIGWSGWFSMSATTDSDPTCVSMTVNRVDVFYRVGQSLWQKYWVGSWSGPIPLYGSITSGPDACSWGTNRIDVFARGPNNDLQQKYWTPNGWSDWGSLGGTLTSDPTCVSMQANRLDVFYRGADGALWQRYWLPTGWSEHISLAAWP